MKTKKFLVVTSIMLGMIFNCMAQNLPGYVPSNGLNAWYSFDGNANDLSGNANNGLVNGPILTTGKTGLPNTAYLFNGLNNNIALPNPYLGGIQVNSFSMHALVNISVSQDNNIWGKTKFWGEVNFSISSTGQVNFIWANNISGNKYSVISSQANVIQPGVWYDIVVVFQNSGGQIYLNGIPIITNLLWMAQGGATLSTSQIEAQCNYEQDANSSKIGQAISGGNPTNYFYGKIDELGIWNRALSQQEITALYTGQPIAPQVTCNPLPSNLQNGLVGYWPFCGNANDESGNGNNGTVNGATLTVDRFGNANSAYNFDGNDFIQLLAPYFNGNSSVSAFTISLWLNQTAMPTSGYYHALGFDSFWKTRQLQIGSSGDINYSGSNNSGYFGTPSITSFNSVGVWSHVLITFNQSVLKIKVNTIDVTSSNIGYSSLDFSAQVAGNSTGRNQFGCISSVSNGNYSFFNGKLDDIAIWNRALTQQEITTLYQATPCVPPSASISPAGPTTFCSGASVTLNANNGSGLLYQWVKDGVNIPNATSASYIATASGNYTVVVSDAGNCSATSSSTSVTVNALPNASITPSGATTFCSGASVVLNANTGSGLTHQWVKDGVNIANAASASYTATTSGNYSVVVTNSNNCSASSSAINVTVNPAPNASAAAAGATTFCAGGSVTLNANTGTGLTYQWKNNGSNIAGAASASYSATQAGSYSVVVSNSNGCSASSSAISVTVNPLPSVQLSSLPAFVNIQAGTVPLNGTPSGGTYSGSGVLGSSFSPTTAGLGSAGVTYAYTTPAGCSGSASQTTIVYDTTGILCTSYDTTVVNIYDTITTSIIVHDTVFTHVNVYDTLTTNITVYDTITTNILVYDTITTNITVYDTVVTNVMIYDTVTTYTTVTDTLLINTTITGLTPPNNANTIKVFPNPTNDHITIDYGNFALMNGYQLRIQNSLGQQVFQTNITQQSDYLSLNNWGGNGLYFVHLIDPQGNTIDIRKIVLQ